MSITKYLRFSPLVIISHIALLLFTACGGGSSSGGTSCEKSTYGTCVDVYFIVDNKEIYTNEDKSLLFKNNENFIGDLNEFTYEWSFSSEQDRDTVTLDKEHGGIKSTEVGEINVTLTVKDKDAILDTETITMTVVEQKLPIVAIDYDQKDAVENGTLKFYIYGSDYPARPNGAPTGTNLFFIATLYQELITGSNEFIPMDSKNEDFFVYDIKKDTSIDFDLNEKGTYKFNFLVIDEYDGEVEQNITINVI
ncbi:hypothetical protein KKC13_06325 [bacterium]|nr:hypothetical protein [bacterium]MBU1957479.1 hypothetical protein [bacterium]